MEFFVTFEGPEGSGKTTHTDLLSQYLKDQGYTVNLTREPGGTSLGESIRELLLDPSDQNVNKRAELYLYLAARAQHVEERIRPALNRGEIVVCDRFTDASLVYQGLGRNLGLETVHQFNQHATNELSPDLTFILDVPVDEGLREARNSSRTQWNSDRGDRIEQEGNHFHQTVREGYRELADRFPDRCVLLSRDAPIDHVQQTIRNHVEEWLVNADENQPVRKQEAQ